MMMKIVLLLIAFAMPMVYAACPSCNNEILDYISGGGDCDGEGTTLSDYTCLGCSLIADLLDKRLSITDMGGELIPLPDSDPCCTYFVSAGLDIEPCHTCAASVNHLTNVNSECMECSDVYDIAAEARVNSGKLCCTELVKLLVEETEQDMLLGANNYGYDRTDESCVDCKELRKIAHNTRCNMYENTCYLPGKSSDGSIGYGSGGYDYPEDSYYTEGSNSYNDYSWDLSYDGYYPKQALCRPQTIMTYFKDSPDICNQMESIAIDCGYGKGTEQNCPVCTNKCGSDYILKGQCPKTVCPDYPIHDSNSALAQTEGTADNTVETVGWILIAVSGVLFLASIAFFMTGRSERKAAAENRMAGHGVMA